MCKDGFILHQLLYTTSHVTIKYTLICDVKLMEGISSLGSDWVYQRGELRDDSGRFKLSSVQMMNSFRSPAIIVTSHPPAMLLLYTPSHIYKYIYTSMGCVY